MKELTFILIVLPLLMFSQESINGIVFESNEQDENLPLAGANVYWLNSSVGTTTDNDGKFSLAYKEGNNRLVISFVGFATDTLTISDPSVPIRHVLRSTAELDEILITGRNQATARSYLQTTNVINVSSDELLKAACCNLSESFETNPSIDVNFADAVTGTRQIRMLGLTSPYILITTENIPAIRGASQAYGLSFIPGTWVESIQITKGAGSVVNGFESISGQINAELQKPSKDDKFFLNLYGGMNGRLELNTHINTAVGDKWHTGLYIHGNYRNEEFDMNDDGFMDVPRRRQINVMNRWQFTNPEKGLVSFINFRVLNDKLISGELGFDPDTDALSTSIWGSEISTNRIDLSAKFGYVNPEIPYRSLGIQIAASLHDQESFYGLNSYNIKHNSVYANVVYNSIISDSRHKIKTGLALTYDEYDEQVLDSDFARNERSIGGFFEYAYDDLDKLTLTAGIRVDAHNLLDEFITPRLHLRYAIFDRSALRFSIGRGKRSANIFAENQSIFATSRQIIVGDANGPIYGLDPEIAWNYGVSFLQGFDLFGRDADVALDFYRTDFTNQVVVDWENPDLLRFYNLRGQSFANSFQVEFNHNTFEGFDLRFAYKFFDVQTDYSTGRQIRPLTPRHRIFGNASYETKVNEKGGRWKFDATYNWLGKQRFASTELNSTEFQLDNFSPSVGTLNVQITKVFSPKFEVYLGGENVTNVRQNMPILDADNPFGENFDTTFVYGPIFGSMYYTGLRYKLN